MRLCKGKNYKVTKITESKFVDYGTMNGNEVRKTIGNAKYDKELGMFFNQNGSIGYDVVEISE